MPAVFTRLDRSQRDFFHGRSTKDLHPSLPTGIAQCHDTQVRSSPISVPGTALMVQFGGALDARLDFDDGTFGIADFKTSSPSEDHLEFYSSQLHAYAWALEHPSRGDETPRSVSILGLLCIDPGPMVELTDGSYAYTADATWMPARRDDASFSALLVEVCALISGPLPPPSEQCAWCSTTARS